MYIHTHIYVYISLSTGLHSKIFLPRYVCLEMYFPVSASLYRYPYIIIPISVSLYLYPYHLGLYPPKTPCMRPRCAQVAIAAQPRVPAFDFLSREPPLPTMEGRRKSAVVPVFTSQPAHAQLLRIR